ncbi:hypothetical protein CEXT_666001 [Caerostris extrusa]|uniref:Uncharacterized protein n=1 Tax=Caerostris extrusa TaxID=172846 RepID=A0AAV4QP06_CAEEX|nr:hypothetical protein CEXT_666001 [Caerostris extrusa]
MAAESGKWSQVEEKKKKNGVLWLEEIQGKWGKGSKVEEKKKGALWLEVKERTTCLVHTACLSDGRNYTDTISAPNNGLITLGKLQLNSQSLRYVVTIHQLRWVYFCRTRLKWQTGGAFLDGGLYYRKVILGMVAFAEDFGTWRKGSKVGEKKKGVLWLEVKERTTCCLVIVGLSEEK